MNDEELKKIVEEIIGNNDPYWNEPVFDVVKKIIALPENTESYIIQLVDDDRKSNTKFMFEIYKAVKNVCKKINIELDQSKHAGQIIGLPFNISFIKRHCNNAKNRKIIIASSAKFYKEAFELKGELENKGYEVIDYPRNINDTVQEEYKEAYERFYGSLSKTDDLILLNLDKKGIEGYIGYESFAELSNLVVRKIQENSDHKIYIYKMPSEQVGCYDEIKHFLELGYIELYK